MIEDVQYLQAHSRKEDFVMFVDSSTRDRATYPRPDSYSVAFDEPFRNVYGVEIVDMLVPRTMYNVDAQNNTLCFACGFAGALADPGAYALVSVPPQDYATDTFYLGLGNSLRQQQQAGSFVVRSQTPANPMDSGKYVYESPVPFAFDLARSSIRETLGFDERARPDNGGCYELIGEDVVAGMRVETSALAARLGAVTTLGEDAWQAFTVSADCDLASVQLAAGPGAQQQLGIVQCDRPGDAAAQQVLPFAAASSLGGRLDGDVANMVRLLAGRSYFAVLRPFASQAGGAGGSSSSMLAGVLCSVNVFRMLTPGLVTLVGERSVLLRIPEVEQHINSSYIYGKNSPGMALIKMGVRGYQQLRFDFTSIKYREFVPIAKLTRLSFSFETVRGTQYDFKGVNHTMLLVVKYLVPYSSDLAENYKPILNPNYKPDMLLYLRGQEQLEGELDGRSRATKGGPAKNEIEQYYEERYADLQSVDGSDSEEDI